MEIHDGSAQSRQARLAKEGASFLALCEEARDRCPDFRGDWDFLISRTKTLMASEEAGPHAEIRKTGQASLQRLLSDLKLSAWMLYHNARDWRMAEEIANTAERTVMRVSFCDSPNLRCPAPEK